MLALVSLGLLAGSDGRAGIAAAAEPPNIVMILADDWGWGDLGCQGNPRVKTPCLDRMAAEGTRFEQFYAAAAVCSPSRASLMTGLFTNRHGIHSHLRELGFNRQRGMPGHLDPQLAMLPRLLHDAGYRTAHFGKWHLTGHDEADAPALAAYGFDDHRVTVCDGDGIHRQPPGAAGWNVWSEARDGYPSARWQAWRAASSRLILDETIRFIEADHTKPFYVQAWLFDTHARLVPTAEQMRTFGNLPTPFRIYYAALADSDAQIGRLLARLAELGIDRETMVIFSSDNGPEDILIGNASEHGVGDPGPFRGRKRSGYEGGIRVPLVVRWPGRVPAGRVDRDTVLGGVDLLSTLCALAGAAIPSGLDGDDMSRAWLGENIERRRPLFWDLREDTVGSPLNASPKLVIRDGRWKLLASADGRRVELYDMATSALEVDNVASEHPDVAKRLLDRLLAWKRGD